MNAVGLNTVVSNVKVKHATLLHVFFLGIIFVIGDLVTSWNSCLRDGFWDCMLANALVGLAYICLTCCQAEMTGMLPFSGGTYGFTRVTLGLLVGYLVGCFEVISNWMFVVETVEFFGDMIHHMVGGSADLQPVYWLFFYFPTLAILLSGSKYFWPTCVVLGTLSLFLVLLYMLAAAPEMDTEKYVTDVDNSVLAKGVGNFLTILPLASHEWLGLQSISLACEDTNDATTVVPHAFLSAVVTLFFISFLIIIAVTSHPPGIREVEDSLVPMNFGYAQAFGIVEQSATVFSIFAVFGTAFSHTFAFSRQLLALARSRLVSKYFSSTLGISDEPALAIIVGSVLGYGTLLLSWGGFKKEIHLFLNMNLIAAYLVYTSIFLSWCIFKTEYNTMPRKFLNPLGYLGVVFGLAVFLLCLVGVLGFEDRNVATIEVFSVVLALLVVYYYAVANKLQTYSPEEQNLLLKLYVIKGNARKRKKKGSKGSRASSQASKSRGGVTNSKSKKKSNSFSENSNGESSGSELSDGELKRPGSVGSSSVDSNHNDPVVAITEDVLVVSSGTAKTSGRIKKMTNALLKGVSNALTPNYETGTTVAPAPNNTNYDNKDQKIVNADLKPEEKKDDEKNDDGVIGSSSHDIRGAEGL